MKCPMCQSTKIRCYFEGFGYMKVICRKCGLQWKVSKTPVRVKE